MHIKELQISNFGKFHNKTLQLKEGINLIYGENESGKSTIHSFIRGMLFGIERLRGRASKDDIYMKYQPWETPGAYNGSIDIGIQDKTYRILRTFDKNNKDFTVLDLDTGRELNLYGEDLIDLYGGLTESGYRNTVSVEQLKSKTDGELVDEVRNYITNLSLSKSNEVDVTKALSFLQNKRKEMEAEKLHLKMKELEDEIENGIKREETMDTLTFQLHKLEKQEADLEKQKNSMNIEVDGMEYFASLEEYQSYLNSFPVIKEKYNIYLQELKHKEELIRKLETLQNELLLASNANEELVNLKEQIKKVGELKSKIWDLDEKRKQTILKYEEQQLKVKSITIWYLIPIIIGIVGCILFLGKGSIQVGIFALVGLIGIGLYGYSAYHLQEKKKEYKRNLITFDTELNKAKQEIGAVLVGNQCNSEQDLQYKYEERIGYKMSQSHLKKQLNDYEDEILMLNEKLKPIKEEVLDYIRLSSKSFNEPLTSNSFNDDPYNHVSRNNNSFHNKSISINSLTREPLLEHTTMNNLEIHIRNQQKIIAEKRNSVQKELEYCRLQKEKIKWELDSLEGNEDKLLRDKDKLKELIKKKKEIEEELEAIQLSIETINSLSIDIHDSFGRDLNQLVSELTNEITNGRYNVLKVDEKLNIKVGYYNNFIRMDKLSTGTIEQIYLALRMAISNLLYGEGDMPIILDDCFAYYDDNRTKASLEFLARKRKGQIILFTCHNREKIILDEINANYNYIKMT